MFAIGNDELKHASKIGDFILCEMCGERHKIQYGKEIMRDGTRKESKLLAFYKCGDEVYLAGFNGKDIRQIIKEP